MKVEYIADYMKVTTNKQKKRAMSRGDVMYNMNKALTGLNSNDLDIIAEIRRDEMSTAIPEVLIAETQHIFKVNPPIVTSKAMITFTAYSISNIKQ
jgi:hypothetical protein